MERTKFKSVKEYFDVLKEPALSALLTLRKNIDKTIPDSEEYIGYQIPMIRYRGKPLIAYAAFKNHCSLYIMSMKTANELKPQLKGVTVNGVTIQFEFDKKISMNVLKKIIVARKRETDEFLAMKMKKK